jgi:hypothetical protein
MNKSDSIKEIAIALNAAQKAMGAAKKDANNPFFSSTYADLNSVISAIKEPFENNGLSYSQFPLFKDGFVGVETIVLHISGEWMSGELVLPIKKQDPQAAGSAITYARRYALQAIAGIPAEDDDGNGATIEKAPQKQSAPVLSATDIQWIKAVRADPAVLETITDPAYKELIRNEVAK